MGYESMHIMELLSVKFLQVDDVILYCCLQCTVVLVDVVLKVSHGGTRVNYQLSAAITSDSFFLCSGRARPNSGSGFR